MTNKSMRLVILHEETTYYMRETDLCFFKEIRKRMRLWMVQCILKTKQT